jgi:RecQ-mediated genome instability protein 1
MSTNSGSRALESQITAALTAANLPIPSDSFLASILSGSRLGSNPPIQPLIATAKHRLLAADYGSNPSPVSERNLSFPLNLNNPQVKSVTLKGAIPVQVMDVEDLSRSRWEHIEALEAAERGETTRGREVIQVAPEENAQSTQAPAAPSGGTHRLVLQDIKGQQVYGLELKAVPGINVGMSIGTKLVLLPGTQVARGLVLLEPSKVVVLGGKIEGLHSEWTTRRKEDLEAAIAQGG